MNAATNDVIVVGAGPIGLTHALILADAGFSVLVLERATQPGDLPRAISLVDESLRVMADLGIAEPLKSESLLDTGSRYFGLNGRLLASAKPMPSRIGQPAKSQFDQPVMEQLLFDRALEHSNIDFKLGHEVTGLSQSVRGVTVEATDSHGANVSFAAEWLVGADGGKSTVRKLANIPLVGSTQPQRWIVIDLLGETAKRDPFAEFHCDGKRPYVLVPGVKGRLRIEFMLFDREDADEMTRPEMIRNLVKPFRPQLDDADVRRAAVYVAHQRIAKHYRVNRLFLIGDAAHLMPPFAGQGLNAGIRDAQNLAWKLIEALRGRATEQLLDSYEVERHTHGAKMVKVSRRVGRVVMATGTVVPRLRDTVVRGLCLIPKVRDFLSGMKFITPPVYTEAGAATATSALPALAEVIGRSLSQPRVQTTDGEEMPLDTVLGTGWSLIEIAGRSARTAPLNAGWEAFGVRHVVIAAGRRPAANGSGSIDLVDLDGSLSKLSGERSRFLLIRPDKYVYGAFEQTDEVAILAKLRELVSF
ncbi:3-(3-hydroxy-phenyl)propionate hydroxylase [Leucobacter exalbidus]|uniref:3-(3-hydroxy-phenyl)propionate hydroxylase n=1 Tax=Leucobacter exalbidus TaxID=662960 RepID=A0A940PT60_9MICO|nr:bifunctional 3-(3-hydroxy-phenyl)propionate/3-hydroxycinnamic acid hydroxylase [Leucobacter exalbidus]MBP1326338.1 3-(3-hydroxy-phenyl)propionate hydroxylase [Leucobacter exalbidus]